MRAVFVWSWLLAALLSLSAADIFLHFPPGSNNRLNGNQDNVRNANRLYDSQNNGKAGYNVGDSLDSNPGENIPEFRQMPTEFYMSGCDAKSNTEVEVMWTNQHGTGPSTDDRVETQVILQYMCHEYPKGYMSTADVNKEFDLHTIRNGQTINTQDFKDGQRESSYIRRDRGLHEPANYYNAYVRRDRNKGLFTADQTMKGTKAINTRQNAAGTRRGLEVPEERDYYPYWGPTPWKDIAIMVSNEETKRRMETFVNSPEFHEKSLCIMPSKLAGQPDCPRINLDNSVASKCVASHITAESCNASGGEWTKFIDNYLEKTAGVLSTCHAKGNRRLVKGLLYEPHLVSQGADGKEQYVVFDKPPDVIYAPSTVVNHNGMNIEGKFSTYKWKVPCFATNTTQRCVLRIRYNITTADVPRHFDFRNNSSVKNNPKTKAVDGETDLQLALNTAQLGRTFQDRSYVILLKPRNRLPLQFQHSNIYYIGGMGKRGNIVQTYPAMEYRFTPERLTVTTQDVVCFVWSDHVALVDKGGREERAWERGCRDVKFRGSNNNQNNAGEGRARSDRTNVCWVKEGCSSLKPPACARIPLEVVDEKDFDLNLHLNKGCYTGKTPLQAQLDNAPASCNPPCFRIKEPGEYCYMSTRNNNFSNRRHMGQIIVKAPPQMEK